MLSTVKQNYLQQEHGKRDILYINYKLLESKRRFFFIPIFLHGSTFLTLLIMIKQVDLVMSCGGDDLKQFADRAEEMQPTHQQMLYLISLRQSVHELKNFN